MKRAFTEDASRTSPMMPDARSPRVTWLQASVLAAAFALLYAPILAMLVRAWLDNGIYRHGFLVPFISGYLAWVKRDRLRALTPAPSFLAGAPLMILAAAMLLVGKFAAEIAILEELSLMPMITGLVLALLGWAHLKALALPIGYLFFMIPVLADGTDWVHWPFQLLAAHGGVWLLQSLGLAALVEGVYIVLPRITLEVAEACSGIRFMISVIAIGIPLAYLTQRTWPRRVALVAFGVLVGIFANSLRIAAIGVVAYYWGVVLHGPFHIFQVMFVSWVGYGALFLGAWFLGRERT